MSFILQEPFTFINVKLTNAGRRQLSLGSLGFASYMFSDREVNYSIDRTLSYLPTSNRILSPVDNQPGLLSSFDGTLAQPLLSQYVSSAMQFATAQTPSYGFFSGFGGSYSAAPTSYSIDSTKILGSDRLDYSANTNGTSQITLAGVNNTPTVGNLVRIAWSSPNYTGNTSFSGNIPEMSATPLNYLFYRIVSGSSTPNTYLLDRAIPNFNNAYSASTKYTEALFYPAQSVETFYGSGATVDPQLWNMNIVRTSSVPGTNSGISGYTSYGSIEYNGVKQYFGFSSETPSFGVVHYTNQFSGNTYAEALIEQSVRVDLPYIMWWNTAGNNGQLMQQGTSLFDIYGTTVTDPISNTNYRNLADGIGSTARVVGRVYHSLKTIVITDQELLTAMTYKADRNWTLPDFNLSLTPNPHYPLNNSQATGLCQSGYTYYVTYLCSSQPYSPNVSYGFNSGLHCGYIHKIDGGVDNFGNPQFLSLNFAPNSFPFLRSSSSMSSTTYSGTGWNCNEVQILVNQQLSGYSYNVGDVPSDGWVLVSSGGSGNGIYTGDTTDLSIDPLKLAGYNFIISQQDYNSGSTYTLPTQYTGETDYKNFSGLTFGNESFFYGNVSANILATTYKTLITAVGGNNDYNDSLNGSYDPLLDDNTYITEVSIFDTNNNLVAVGKPSYPVTKNNARYLVIQLEMDF